MENEFPPNVREPCTCGGHHPDYNNYNQQLAHQYPFQYHEGSVHPEWMNHHPGFPVLESHSQSNVTLTQEALAECETRSLLQNTHLPVAHSGFPEYEALQNRTVTQHPGFSEYEDLQNRTVTHPGFPEYESLQNHPGFPEVEGNSQSSIPFFGSQQILEESPPEIDSTTDFETHVDPDDLVAGNYVTPSPAEPLNSNPNDYRIVVIPALRDSLLSGLFFSRPGNLFLLQDGSGVFESWMDAGQEGVETSESSGENNLTVATNVESGQMFQEAETTMIESPVKCAISSLVRLSNESLPLKKRRLAFSTEPEFIENSGRETPQFLPQPDFSQLSTSTLLKYTRRYNIHIWKKITDAELRAVVRAHFPTKSVIGLEDGIRNFFKRTEEEC